MPWSLYDKLINEIPSDILVKDYCLGNHWTYVDAECGMGVSYTCSGGAKFGAKGDFRGRPLREMAELSKSWHFHDATLGIAALNAWYSQKDKVASMGAVFDESTINTDGVQEKSKDAFDILEPRIRKLSGTLIGDFGCGDSDDNNTKNEATNTFYSSRISAGEASTIWRGCGNAKVVVVGHFPHVEDIARYAKLTVLERSPRDAFDTPDPACEYVMPEADFAFITGVTLENKTAPRLLELARNAYVCMVGPSVIPSPALFDYGVNMIAGRVVLDSAIIRDSVKSGGGITFSGALQMFTIERN